MSGVDYYELFSLAPSAELDELRKQYRRLSLQFHPDRGGSTEQMARLNEAYRTLSNPLLRKEYDQKLARLELTSGSGANYHYTHATPTRRAAATQQTGRPDNFWRRFIVWAIFGAAFLVYDIMSVIVLPSMVKETPRSSGTLSAPVTTSDLTDEANAAISEMPQSGR